MPLVTLTLSPRAQGRVTAAPELLRNVVLRAENPALFAEVSAIDEMPQAARARLARLSSDTAVLVVGNVSVQEALEVAMGDKRLAVRQAVLARRAELMDGGDACSDGVQTVGTNTVAETPRQVRTAAALAGSLSEVPGVLRRLKDVDDGVLLRWARSQPAGAPWEELAGAVMPRTQAVVAVLGGALLHESLDVETLWSDPRLRTPLLYAVATHTGELTGPMVRVLEMAVAGGAAIVPLRNNGVTQEARTRLADAIGWLRILAGVGDDEDHGSEWEMRCGWGSDWSETAEFLMELVAGTRTAAGFERLSWKMRSTIELFGEFRVWAVAEIVGELLTHTLSEAAQRELLSCVGVGQEGELNGPGAGQEAAVIGAIMRALTKTPAFDEGRALMQRMQAVVPGIAIAVCALEPLLESWVLEELLKAAGDVLGDNQTAWSVLLDQMPSYPGCFSELCQAALMAASG